MIYSSMMKCLFLLATNNLTGALRKRSCPIPKSFFGHLTCTSNQSAGEAHLQAHSHRKYTNIHKYSLRHKRLFAARGTGGGRAQGCRHQRFTAASRTGIFPLTSVRKHLFLRCRFSTSKLANDPCVKYKLEEKS